MLATANYINDTVSTYTLDANCVPTLVGTVATAGYAPVAVTFSPNGQFLAVGTDGPPPGHVYVFSVSAGGALTAVPGSPLITPGRSASAVAFSPNGNFLAEVEYTGTPELAVFAVAANGALTLVPGSVVSIPGSPVSVAWDPTGTVLAVANAIATPGTGIDTFTVSAAGVPTLVHQTGLPNERSVRFVAGPAGTLLVAGDGNNNSASVYSLGAGGLLTALPGSPYATGGFVYEAAFNANGSLVATANTTTNNVSVLAFQADLSLTKTAAPTPVLHGQNVTYTLTVNNAGGGTAAAPTVTDTLPAGQTFLFSDVGGCTAAGGTPVVVTCPLADLPASSMNVIHITASTAGIPAPLYAPLVQTNTAVVGSTTFDPNLADNTATAQVTVVPAADLALTKTGTPNPVIGGQDLVYTLTATNLGPDPALSPTITDTLPAGEVFDAEASSPGCSAVGSVVTCVVPTTVEGPGPGNYFDAGATATFTIAVTPTNTGAGPITDTNTATISSATADPNLANNTGTAVTTVSTSCTQTITGKHVGTIIVPAGTFLCLNGATQTGAILVRAGGGLTVTDSTVIGGVETDHATFVTICGSSFPSAGAVLIEGTALLTRVGDDDFNCPGSHFTGSVTVENSVGGVEVFGNTIRGALAVTGNTSSTPAVADDTPEVEGNTVGGSIECKANVPPPVNDGLTNTAAGAKLHQCASL